MRLAFPEPVRQKDSVLSKFKVGFDRILHQVEEQEEAGKWVVLSEHFDRAIPFKKIRILNKRSKRTDERASWDSVLFKDQHHINGIDFWLLNIFEGMKKIYIYDCQSVGDNLFEYEFANEQHFERYERNAPRNQVWVYIESRYYALLDGYYASEKRQ